MTRGAFEMTSAVKGSRIERMFHWFVKMGVDMQAAAVFVRVDVERGAAEDFPKDAGTQANQHYSNGKFHPQSNFRRNLKIEGDDQKPDGQKRGGVPQAPQSADKG